MSGTFKYVALVLVLSVGAGCSVREEPRRVSMLASMANTEALQEFARRSAEIPIAQAWVKFDGRSVQLGFLAELTPEGEEKWMVRDGRSVLLKAGRIVGSINLDGEGVRTLDSSHDSVADWVLHKGTLPSVGDVSRHLLREGESQWEQSRLITASEWRVVATQRGVRLAYVIAEAVDVGRARRPVTVESWFDASSRRPLYVEAIIELTQPMIKFESITEPDFRPVQS
ncbi:MAG: hypothetical protein ABF296_03335 [Oceanococcaceae bacterium]